MVRQIPDGWSDLGSFIRDQRNGARLSLRRLSELAGVSNPYLSQIERGLRRPSAEILQQIAKALRISAETLYVQAGILEPPEPGSEGPGVAQAILADPALHPDQKHALLQVYRSFRHENRTGGSPDEASPDGASPDGAGPDVAGGAAGRTDGMGAPPR
jgi:transcriptional regulator with XRE-family HTH domain